MVPSAEEWPGALSQPLQLGNAPAHADETQLEALWWVNTYRFRAGLPPIDEVSPLNQAAVLHAEYVASNNDLYEHEGLSIHTQLAERDGFLAANFWDRAAAAGYDGAALREVIAYQATPAAAVAHWMETAYHRLPLLHPRAHHLGYGQAATSAARVNVLDLGAGDGAKVHTPEVSVWPPDGAEDVATEWNGIESPKPPAPSTGFPSGPVITATLPAGSHFEIIQHFVRDIATNKAIAHVLLTPSNDPNLEGETSIVMYPDDPLAPGRTYEVYVRGVMGGVEFDHSWSFTTRADPGCGVIEQDCGAGRGCYGSVDADAACLWEGASEYGDTCAYQNDCQTGLTCVGGQCRPFCLLDGTSPDACGEKCAGAYSRIDLSGPYGVCAAP